MHRRCRGQDIAIGAGGLGFDSRDGQIEHSVATAAIFLRSCAAQELSCGDGSSTRYTLRCNIASVVNIFFECIRPTAVEVKEFQIASDEIQFPSESPLYSSVLLTSEHQLTD